MFLRSYAVYRIGQHIRKNETAVFITEHLKAFNSFLMFSTNVKEVKTSNKNPTKYDSAADNPSDDIGYHKITLSCPENASTLSNYRDANRDHKIHIINSDTLLEKKSGNFDDTLVDIHEKIPGPLDECTEDISHIGPFITPTYNFAKYANESHIIQEFIKLGVQLYKLEKDKDVMNYFLIRDFDKDIKPYIQFLYDCGLPAERLGVFITHNPKIFMEDMDDLHTRIRYLRVHNFSLQMIQNIVYRNPLWLSFTTKQIDERLGYFQNTYKLNGSEVRHVASESPRVITTRMSHLREKYFSLKEEMGFDQKEIKHLLLTAPAIWLKARYSVVNVFDYVHNEMNIPHNIILNHPKVLVCRKDRIKNRHMFLLNLKKAQYDPHKPMYISLDALIAGSDIEFCTNVAKCNINTYDLFLKSL